MENKLFTETCVPKAYLSLSLPLVLSMVVTMIYNLADTYFVAQTNDTNLVAGVSLGLPIFTLLMAFGNILGQGGSSLISRLLGKNEFEDVRRVSSFCFYITLFIGVFITALMLVFKLPILNLIGADPETFQYASDYYIYLAIGAPAIMLSFIHSNLLRSEGLSRESMIGTVGGAVVNIILDPILISVLDRGAGGAAIATVIGYLFADVFYLIIVVRQSQNLSMNPSQILIPAQYIAQITGIGIPAAISNLMQSVAVILLNQFLLPYGNDKIAAMGIVIKVSLIAFLVLTGFAFGGQPLFGYYYGASMKDKLRELLSFDVKFISTVAVVLTAGTYILAPQIMAVFMDDVRIVSDGTQMLRWQVISMVFVGLVLLATVMFQSLGKPAGSLLLSLSRQGIVFLVILLIASRALGYAGIIASQAMADVITAGISFILFRRQLYKEFF